MNKETNHLAKIKAYLRHETDDIPVISIALDSFKGNWCPYYDKPLFCQEEAGCLKCEIYLSSLCELIP